MDTIKTGYPEIDQCTEEIIEVLKRHRPHLGNVETIFSKVKLAIRLDTPVFGRNNYSADNSSNTAE